MTKFIQSFILWWLKTAAKIQLAKSRPMIIGVTGSAGKSSAVQAIGLALQPKFKTYFTQKGNSETGIPFEILGIPVENYTGFEWVNVMAQALVQLLTNWKTYDVLVLEMGIDSQTAPKNMSYLLSIVKPSIGVFLNVSSVHGENFTGPDIPQSIANEKSKLLKALPASGLAIYSADHSEIKKAVGTLRAPTKTFSVHEKSDIELLSHEVSLKGTNFTFSYQDKKYELKFKDQTHFKESFGSFASAILIADTLGITPEKVVTVLQKKYSLLPGRMSIIPGIQKTTLIDSSYNSSLEATSAALEMLKMIKSSGRKVAVLGDMRELGEQAKPDHQKLAQVAAQTADVIILVGPLAHRYCWQYLRGTDFPAHRLFSFPQAYAAAAVIPKIIQEHDLLLIKGSQNTIFLEIIVKALMLEPQKASSLLCRQTPYWEAQRQKLIEQPFLTK